MRYCGLIDEEHTVPDYDRFISAGFQIVALGGASAWLLKKLVGDKLDSINMSIEKLTEKMAGVQDRVARLEERWNGHERRISKIEDESSGNNRAVQ